MEQRRYERKTFHLKAELIAGKVNYACFIENLSEYGVYVEIEPSNAPVEFYPDTQVELKLQLSTGETLNLHGVVRWSRTIGMQNISYVGIEILKPPPEYRDFLKTLK